jgi:hypothetical protein
MNVYGVCLVKISYKLAKSWKTKCLVKLAVEVADKYKMT